jgi:translation initiation factor IF-2
MVVNISGWDSLPSAGEDLIVVDSADRARNIAQLRAQQHADADAIKYYKDAVRLVLFF